jgi:hypothetical protein
MLSHGAVSADFGKTACLSGKQTCGETQNPRMMGIGIVVSLIDIGPQDNGSRDSKRYGGLAMQRREELTQRREDAKETVLPPYITVPKDREVFHNV